MDPAVFCFDHRPIELMPLIDVNGLAKPTFQSIAEEALDVATEDGCIVAVPGDELPALQVQLLN